MAVWKHVAKRRQKVISRKNERHAHWTLKELHFVFEKCAQELHESHLPLLETVLQSRVTEMVRIKKSHRGDVVVFAKLMLCEWVNRTKKSVEKLWLCCRNLKFLFCLKFVRRES